MEFFFIIKEGRDLIDIVQTIAAIAIPIAALVVAVRGVKTWQVDKITHIYDNIKSKIEAILKGISKNPLIIKIAIKNT